MHPANGVQSWKGRARHMAIKTITSEPVREIHSWLGAIPYYKTRANREDSVVVNISGRMGMGALVAKALQFYALAEKENIKLDVISSCSLYCDSDEEDVFSTFFNREKAVQRYNILSDNAYRWALRHAVPKSMNLQDASSLFAEKFRPNRELSDVVSNIITSEGPFDLSIHYRGTDKVLESGNVEYSRILNPLEEYISNNAVNRIFLATDDEAFEEIVREKFATSKFSTYNLGGVMPGVPRHFSNLQPRSKALEALANSYIIASSPVCIRTSSYLSSLSKIINPELKTYTINRTQSNRVMFPEDTVLNSEENWAIERSKLSK